MAYTNIYYAGWSSKTKKGYLYIDKLDYVGTASKLKLRDHSVLITPTFEDWNSPIIGMRAEFEIINDKLDFFELLPLLSAEEREYKIRIVVTTPTAYTLFEGFLNCDTVTEKFLHRQAINFTASSYLSKLENIHPISIDTLQYKGLIDVIDEILVSTGASYNIRVNCSLRAEGDILSAGQTLFNKNGFWTELFWNDEVERFTSLEILRTILTSFDCYIYWWRDHWYIERYENIWGESVDYVEYTSVQTYNPTQAGTVVNVAYTIEDLYSLVFTDQSQTLSIIPGYKTIQINLQDKRLVNLVRQDLYNIASFDGLGLPVPTNRNWLYVTDPSITWGASFTYSAPSKVNLINSITRTRTLNIPALPIPLNKGLFAGFRVTVNAEDVQLSIKFKFAFDPISIYQWTGVWADYTFKFHYYLRMGYPENTYLTKAGDTWKRLYSLSELEYMQEVSVPGSKFDTDNKSVEISITVPLGQVETYSEFYDGKLSGDQFIILCIGAEEIYKGTETTFTHAGEAWFGDVIISTTGGLQDNVISGVVNSNFLNKKEIALDLYDMESFNYKNGIFRGDNLEYRTERWGTVGGADIVLARGVCWSSAGTPTIADSKTVDGTGFGTFESLLTGLLPATTYYIRAYATSEVGTTYGTERTFITDTIAVNEYFQGGIIGYIFQPGDVGYYAGQVHGLIVAPVDQSNSIFWGSLAKPIPTTPLANGLVVGTGLANSNLILAGDAQYSEFAAKVCADYENDGYADWFLPSREELVKIRQTMDTKVAGFSSTWYWTSSESDFIELFSSVQKYSWAVSFGAMIINFTTAKTDTWKKNNNMRVRAVRQF